MSKPVKVSISVYRGDRYDLYFRYRESTVIDGFVVPGDYINLTGWVPTGKIKLNLEDPDNEIVGSFLCQLDDQTDPNKKGGVSCTILPIVCKNLNQERYVYDIQLTLDAEHVKTPIYGTIRVTKDVTPDA